MATEPEPENKNPFIGPRPFEQKDKGCFFGRLREVNDLVSLIIAHRVVLLYAQSGAGKTSLLNAALTPRLEEEGFEVLPTARVRTAIPEGPLPESISNIFIFAALTGWSQGSANAQRLAGTNLAGFLKDKPHQMDKGNLPLPRLLAFDQFEELFTFYPDRWKDREGFFRQVDDALEADPLLRVVLVIREDFLANLDPYVGLLPERLRARYRLECLRREAACDAVQRPLAGTGRRFAEGVAAILVEKLATIRSEEMSGSLVETVGEYVEPVQLQVVCQRLWNKLPSEVREITSAHLEEYGDVTLALWELYENALRAVQQKSGVKEDTLRGLFEYKLITPFGTRGTVLRGLDATEGIPNTAIDELQNQHIIRSEARAGGVRWYELTHDRLVGPVRKSNEGWKRRFEMRSKRRRVAQLVFPLMALVLIGVYIGYLRLNENWEKQLSEMQKGRLRDSLALVNSRSIAERKGLQDRLSLLDLKNALSEVQQRNLQDSLRFAKEKISLQDYWLARGQIDELRNSFTTETQSHEKRRIYPESALRAVASYLWTKYVKGDNGSLDSLINILKGSQDLIPLAFGRDEYSRYLMPPGVEESTPWPLTLAYNTKDSLDLAELQYWWRSMAVAMATSWGIPAPTRLRIIPDVALPSGNYQVRLDRAWAESTSMGRDHTLRVPFRKGYVVVCENKLPEALRPFFDANKKEWTPLPGLEYGGPWWLAPHWTQPLWEAAGHSSSPYEGAVALSLANYFIENPELVINPACVEFLFKKVKESYPQTADEALVARGGIERLRADLVEMVKQKQALTSLEFWFDALGHFPNLDAEAAVEEAIRSQTLGANQSFVLRGQREQTNLILEYADSLLRPYDEISPWLNATDVPIRVYLGERLLGAILDDRGELVPEMREGLDRIRTETSKRFGVVVPGVRFRNENGKIGASSYRIEILNQDAESDGAREKRVEPERAVDSLLKDLRYRSLWARQWWITPEKVYWWKFDLPENLGAWLTARYSITDLKIILRMVISPDGAEVTAYDEGKPVEEVYPVIPRERTIESLAWLLRSLVFWTAAYNPLESGQMAECLVRTQHARLYPDEQQEPADEAGQLVVDGIQHLERDSIDLAATSFKTAISLNRRQAERAFLSHYPPQSSPESLIVKLTDRCSLPEPGSVASSSKPTSEVRYEVESFVERSGAKLDGIQRRQLLLYLLWSYTSEKQPTKSKVIIDSLIADFMRTPWLPDESYLLAYWMLESHGWKMTKPTNLGQIRQLLVSAFRQWKEKQARTVFYELMDKYKAGKEPEWYLLILQELADQFPESFWIPYALGANLAFKQNESGPRESLRLLNQAESHLDSVRSSDRGRTQAWIDYFKAQASVYLAEYGARQNQFAFHGSAVALLDKIIASVHPEDTRWPTMEYLFSMLHDAYVAVNEIDSAQLVIDRGLVAFPNSTSLLSSKFFLHCALLQADSALAVSEYMRGMAKTAEDSVSALWISTVAKIFTNDPDAEHTGRLFLYSTQHEYGDYIRMMLYWMLRRNGNEAAAQQYIDERWMSIHPSEWGERVEQGDIAVWREMLIGRYEQYNQIDVLSTLSDKSTYESSVLSQLGTSYEGLYCEGYFYDALFQSVNGNPTTRRERFRNSLMKALSTNHFSYIEYHMAKYLMSIVDR